MNRPAADADIREHGIDAILEAGELPRHEAGPLQVEDAGGVFDAISRALAENHDDRERAIDAPLANWKLDRDSANELAIRMASEAISALSSSAAARR
jgi:hypothetical protein